MNSPDNPLPSSFDNDPDFFSENRMQKLWRKVRQEPLIPLGMCLTTWALLGATKSIRAGTKHRTNMMFRRRIYAQGFTIAAMCAGALYWREDREKWTEYGKLQEKKKAAEKKDQWLKELEFRDREEKERLEVLRMARQEKKLLEQEKQGR